ncbi:hypothetical protein NQ314_019162 [Rhamnusium bicolor]|uniref:DDE Tnp4 domain-containing protein n=1 Tax=Rhamnusium bicolor TaxID=1586634 RepID=A0AAV8WQ87_9CUCU|nr:hypothetical protein NQ314_019162 [Rhamnusium bicolor]
MTEEQRVFNYILNRGRRVVENVFGILANRFRIFLTIHLSPEKEQIITLASCALHNFLRTKMPTSLQDEEINNNFTFKFGLCHQGSNRTKDGSPAVREEFKDYFMNEGAVPWQYNRV